MLYKSIAFYIFLWLHVTLRWGFYYFVATVFRAALVKTKGKFVVNEKCLLQLFSSKCPLCDSNLKMKNFSKGALIIVNQQCIQCEYRKKWKSQASLQGPATEDQYLTVDISPQLQQVGLAPSVNP